MSGSRTTLDPTGQARKHMETKSYIGEFLKYMQQNEPHLFEETLDAQIQKLSSAAEQDTQVTSNSQAGNF